MTNVLFGPPQILSSFLMTIICCFTDCAATTVIAHEKSGADVLLRKTAKRQKRPSGQLAADIGGVRLHRYPADGQLVRNELLVRAAERDCIFGALVRFRQRARRYGTREVHCYIERGIVTLLCQPGGHAVVQPYGHPHSPSSSTHLFSIMQPRTSVSSPPSSSPSSLQSCSSTFPIFRKY